MIVVASESRVERRVLSWVLRTILDTTVVTVKSPLQTIEVEEEMETESVVSALLVLQRHHEPVVACNQEIRALRDDPSFAVMMDRIELVRTGTLTQYRRAEGGLDSLIARLERGLGVGGAQ